MAKDGRRAGIKLGPPRSRHERRNLYNAGHDNEHEAEDKPNQEQPLGGANGMAVDDTETERMPDGKNGQEYDNRTPGPVAVGAHRDGREQNDREEERDEGYLGQT